ncbi:MAG: O-antigen ligase family protein [Bacteroidales bacterium]
MYSIISAFIAFESYFDNSLKIFKRIFWLILALLFLISLYFLSSRSGILAGLILIPFYFFLKLKQLKKGKFIFPGILLIIIFSFPLLLNNQRVNYLYDQMLNKKTVGENKEEPRIIIWRSACKIIKANFFVGVGIGDVRNELAKQYMELGKTDMADTKFNVHNQFLEVFVEEGIIGFILFIAMISLMIYFAIADKNLLYGVFIIMILIFFTFETILYRFAGISFFSLFSFLLLHIDTKKPLLYGK